MADRILTPSELAELLTVSVPTIDALVRDGLPCIELAHGARRFLLSETLAWLRSRIVSRVAPSPYQAALERRHEELRAEVEGEPIARVSLAKRGAR